jgi:hypothetical protein
MRPKAGQLGYCCSNLRIYSSKLRNSQAAESARQIEGQPRG